MPSDPEPNESQPLLRDTARLEDQAPTVKATPLPKAQLTALCMARLSDPIGYTQIFPYINEFIASLHVTDDPAKMGFYSGLVESTSSIAAMLTVFHWGKLSDIIGRRPVILAGALGMTMVSSLFGLSRSLVQILALRAISGLFAGNSAVYQTILAELTDSTNQATAYPIYGGIYPLGATVGPIIGGFLSNLAAKYPNYFGYSFLEAHPYFPPGFVCALIALLGFSMTYCFLEETLPSKRTNVPRDGAATAPSDARTMGILELLAIPNVRAISASSTALAFLDVGFSVVFVLFCYTPIKTGGLGFSAREIGYAMAMSSGSFATLQFLVMPFLMSKFTTIKLYIFCMGVWPFTFLLLPLLNLIARMSLANRIDDGSDVRFKVLLWLGIAVVVICWRVACLAYPNNAILVRNNSPSSASLGAANGLNMLAMGVARCSSPAFVSSVFALSVNNHLLGGYLWVGVMATAASLGFWFSTKVPR
ncbi:major facilitator superfamily domain-containing protein [Mycena latifolia]|nr:major facilitator superfamily domain-containing protein [Mycena latifolia]